MNPELMDISSLRDLHNLFTFLLPTFYAERHSHCFISTRAPLCLRDSVDQNHKVWTKPNSSTTPLMCDPAKLTGQAATMHNQRTNARTKIITNYEGKPFEPFEPFKPFEPLEPLEPKTHNSTLITLNSISSHSSPYYSFGFLRL